MTLPSEQAVAALLKHAEGWALIMSRHPLLESLQIPGGARYKDMAAFLWLYDCQGMVAVLENVGKEPSLPAVIAAPRGSQFVSPLFGLAQLLGYAAAVCVIAGVSADRIDQLLRAWKRTDVDRPHEVPSTLPQALPAVLKFISVCQKAALMMANKDSEDPWIRPLGQSAQLFGTVVDAISAAGFSFDEVVTMLVIHDDSFVRQSNEA